MNDEQIHELMMKVVDGLATPEEKETLDATVGGNEKWETELRAYMKIKEVTDSMQFKELPDSYWSGYWGNIYRKTERGLGWIFMSVGAIILLVFGLYTIFSEFFADPSVSLVVKVAVAIGGVGVVILLVSILRERCFARKHERYEREVER
jgi:hypothetical protein